MRLFKTEDASGIQFSVGARTFRTGIYKKWLNWYRLRKPANEDISGGQIDVAWFAFSWIRTTDISSAGDK